MRIHRDSFRNGQLTESYPCVKDRCSDTMSKNSNSTQMQLSKLKPLIWDLKDGRLRSLYQPLKTQWPSLILLLVMYALFMSTYRCQYAVIELEGIPQSRILVKKENASAFTEGDPVIVISSEFLDQNKEGRIDFLDLLPYKDSALPLLEMHAELISSRPNETKGVFYHRGLVLDSGEKIPYFPRLFFFNHSASNYTVTE